MIWKDLYASNYSKISKFLKVHLKHYSFKDVRVYFIVELIFFNLQKLFNLLYDLDNQYLLKLKFNIYILIIESFYYNSFAFDIFTILETSIFSVVWWILYKGSMKKKKMKKVPQNLNKKIKE